MVKPGQVMLPKKLHSIGGYHPSRFYNLSPLGAKYAANAVLKEIGFQQLAIYRDGEFDSYSVPAKWTIERDDESGFRLTTRKREGLVVVENAIPTTRSFLSIQVPVDGSLEDLTAIAASERQILVPIKPLYTWRTSGHLSLENPRKDSYEFEFYASALPFEQIPVGEQRRLRENALGNFYRVTLPEGAHIEFQPVGSSSIFHELVAVYNLDGVRRKATVQWWPGWHFGGKRRNACARLSVSDIDLEQKMEGGAWSAPLPE